MLPPDLSPPAPAATRLWWRDRSLLPWLPLLGMLGLLWIGVLNQQRLEWTVNVVYSYGWAVPVLAIYLLWERWPSRPAVAPGMRSRLFLVVAAGLLFAYLPVRIIQEANPDWVRINWLMAGIALGTSWLAFAAIGGWRYALHFSFPLLFCLTALPWPVWMETFLVQELMRGNANICAEILTWSGTPALAEGNIIQIASRRVNVEEACSGIRSLQTAFMMALFLGELHRLKLIGRLGLLLCSFGVAIVINLLRTLLLTHLSGTADLIDLWHDRVGIGAMVLTLAALWIISELFRRLGTPAPTAASAASTPVAHRPIRPPWPVTAVVAGMVWLVGAELATRAWYAYHERHVPPLQAWHIAWPVAAPDYQPAVFAERTLALLKYNTGETATWTSPAGNPWQMYYLTWNPGRVSRFLARSHYPTVCLPAVGLELVAELGAWEVVVNHVTLPFMTYQFAQGERHIYVFHAILEDRQRRTWEDTSYRQVSSSDRLASVWHGERNLGQRVIGIAIAGAASSAAAREAVAEELASLIHPGVHSPDSSVPLSP